MVAGICQGSDHSDQSLVPSVRLVCPLVIGAEHVGQRAALSKGQRARDLLRRVVSRRRGPCELGLVSAMISLLQRDETLYEAWGLPLNSD